MPEQFLHGAEVVEINDGGRVITTVSSSVIGIVGTAPAADATAFPLNTPVLIAGSAQKASFLGATGTLPDAIDSIFDEIGAAIAVVRVTEGANEAETLANVMGGVDTVTHQYTGCHALLGANAIVNQKPKILIAPGFTHQRPIDSGTGLALANPVVAELIGIADRLRAAVIADGPSTSDEAAFAYAQDFGSKRVYMVDPRIKKYDTTGAVINSWSSAKVAGIIAKTDNELGFWWSPSNKTLNGVIGTERPIDFSFGDTSSRANLLNAAKITTIIHEDGYRLWGNRTLSDDPKWAFLSVVRTADLIHDSLLRAHRWAVDQNITKTYFKDVSEEVNNYLRHLQSIGAILGGVCWYDKDLNSPSELAAGRVYFDFDFTPPTPAEHITFRSHMTDKYFASVVA